MAEYEEAYAKVVAAKQELRALQTAEKEDAQRVDMLKFQLQEIEEANIYVGREEQLRKEKENRSSLTNYDASKYNDVYLNS